MLAEGGALVGGAEHTALLEEGNDLVREAVEPSRGEVRHQDESVADLICDEPFHAGGHGGR